MFQGAVATLAGYGLWAHLLRRYPASLVAPYSLLVPVFGIVSSAIMFGERFGVVRLFGMALILVGIAVVALPTKRFARKPGAAS